MSAYRILPVLLLLFASPIAAQRAYTLTFVKTESILNEHVGNEWAFGAWLNETPLGLHQPVVFEASNGLELSIAAAETNEKYNDRGDESVELTAAQLPKLASDGGFYLDVTVVEHNGRYAGGRAVWRFYFSLE